ncbi:MAG: CBS domain-containing protein [Candidatus Promineifilaceae bacterium]|nr:CBS domain-containing protein [Candidatus Promineifilaceae bacterium]
MLVNKRMSSPVITIEPKMPIMEALDLMKNKGIRRTPVVKDGKLVGIVSDKDLLNAAPSDATSLSVWELNYLLAKITVDEVMTKNVITVTHDTPIEEAAYLMAVNKIGGLPVLKEGYLVGLITETDLFRIFLELMGAQQEGVRVTALVPDKLGELDILTHAIAEARGEFLAFSQFAGDNITNRIITFKVRGLDEDQVREKIEPFIEDLVDIRTCCQ